MTDTAKKRLPFPAPSVDGAKDPAHLYHQEVANPPSAIEVARIGESAYAAFMELASLEITEAQYDSLLAAMDKITTNVVTELGKLSFPSEHGEQDGDKLFTPYLATLIFQLLSVLVGSMMPEKTHAERFAFTAELMRAWAAFGVFNAAKQAGLTNEQAGKLNAAQCTLHPTQMGVIAHVHTTRRQIEAEAKASGKTPEEVAREKMAAIIAERKSGGRMPGDPDDDHNTVRMEF